MKVCILTYRLHSNFGFLMQAYALQQIVKALGHDPYTVDIRVKPFNFKESIKHMVKSVLLYTSRRVGYTALPWITSEEQAYIDCHTWQFLEAKLQLTPSVKSIRDLKHRVSHQYDFYLVGSDQVWNTSLTNGYDKMYWGNFIFRKDCKLISYAASMQDEIKEESKDDIKKMLSRFSSISVRETSIAECLRSFVCKDVSVVLDPTLLLTKEQWGNLCHNRIVKEPYLLFYQVRKNDKAKSIAERVAKQLHLKLIYLSAGIDLHNSVDVINSGPIEFVNLFKYANFVVCTSFHGTVFSIIFNVPFYSVLLNDGKDSRAVDLLSKLGLADRGIASYEEKELKLEIEWQKVERKLTELKKDSENYLRKFIE